MWTLSKIQDSSYNRLLLTNTTYTVGRTDTDLIVLDCSVSRLHAKIYISYPNDAVEADSLVVPDLKVIDLSRFGTFLNGNKLIPNVTTSVPSGSSITFGATPGSTLIAKMSPLNVLLSSVNPILKTQVKSAIHSLGGKIFCEWKEECNLLVMSKLIVTHKVLCCLLRNLDIVTPDYLFNLVSCNCENFGNTDRSRFLPPIEEKGFSSADSRKFYANPNRRHIFDGKTFIFLSEAKLQRFTTLLNLTDAHLLCIENVLASSRQYFINTFASVSDPCLVCEPTNRTPERELVYSVLAEVFNKRPISEHEIALAIIEGSCETYCNATCQYSSHIAERSLSVPIEYIYCHRRPPAADISNHISRFKRPREGVNDPQKLTKIKEPDSDYHCVRTSQVPPSTIFPAVDKKPTSRSRILVADTEGSTSPNVIHGCSRKVADVDYLIPDSCPASVSSKLQLSAEGSSSCESTEHDPLLKAFDSMQSLSVLRKKSASSTVERTISTPRMQHCTSRQKLTAEKITHKQHTDPNRSSMSLSSIHGSGTLLEPQKFAEPNKENLPTYFPKSSVDEFQYGESSQMTSKECEDEKNLIPAGVGESPVKVDISVREDNTFNEKTVSNDRVDPPITDFKRFSKVWPTCYGDVMNGKEKIAPNPPNKVLLEPFVPESKVYAKAPTSHPDDPDVQSRDKDSILIDELFDQLTALPRVRRR